MDRSELARCWAKCIAYLAVGKTEAAREWFLRLVRLLNDAGLGVQVR